MMKNLNTNLQNIKKIAFGILVATAVFSCTPNDPVDPNNPNGNLIPLNLVSIQSTNLPTGNSCNKWNLNTSSSATPGTFTNLRPMDFITSTAGLLGQTTMSYNTSAWDKVNKRYAVAIKESLTVYDFSSSLVPAPTTYITNAEAIEFVAGTLYVIRNGSLQKEVSGSFLPLATAVSLPTALTENVSSMTTNGVDLFFIIGNKMYQYATSGTLINTTVLSGTFYDGVEFNNTDSKIYAIKQHLAAGSSDELVRITSGVGDVTIATLGYTIDYSKVTTAYDYNTKNYIIFSSNGHSSDKHSITNVSNLTTTPIVSTVTSTGTQYVFGLQIKD